MSKTDLENLGSKKERNGGNEPTGGIVHEKMKVFQSTKKKWFRNLKPNSSAKDNTDADLQSKRMSLDRYQDMSKLLQERFGGDIDIDDKQDSGGRASSELGVDPRRATIDSSELRQKSMSMQDMDSRSDFSTKPDVVNVDFVVHNYPDSSSSSAADGAASVNDDSRHHMDICHDDDEDHSMMSFTNNQKSFITEKLCTEFHVKTTNHSKSSSNLQQLLHFQVPQKMNIHETPKKPIDQLDEPIKTINFTMIPTTSIDDDLPYSSVRDSLVYQPSVGDNLMRSSSGNGHNQLENIYAEICTDGMANGGSVRTRSNSGHRRSAIRISVGSSVSNSFDVGPSSMRHSSVDSSSTVDNIYNTLK